MTKVLREALISVLVLALVTRFVRATDEEATEASSSNVKSLAMVGDIIREPDSGELTLPEGRNGDDEEDGLYVLKCMLEDSDAAQLVSDIQWFQLDDDGEWEELSGQSKDTLDVGAIVDDSSMVERFQCQIGGSPSEGNAAAASADFAVFVGNRSAEARKMFKVRKFKQSYDVEEGEDFQMTCDITSRAGNVAEIKEELAFK